MSMESKIAAAIELIQPSGTLYRYLPHSQRSALQSLLTGEEGEHFADLLSALASRIETMPVTYGQDGKGNAAIVHLHYFRGSVDFWITEKDVDDGVSQSFGLARIGGNDPELGYISIEELTRAGVELDLYWQETTIGEVKRAQGV